MRLEFCTDLGFLRDVECIVDADLERTGGQRKVIVNDIIMDGHSLYRSEDKRMMELAYWLQEEAEGDEHIRNVLLNDAREDA
jgi:hypothetical protein